MKVLIHASLDFKNQIESTAQFLQSNNFIVLLPNLVRYQHIRDELGHDEEFTLIKNKLTCQNIGNVEKCDSLLILNFDHRGIKNYIGGNSFLEMVIAFYLHKNCYLLNNIPEGMPYTEEIKALFPKVVYTLEDFIFTISGRQI